MNSDHPIVVIGCGGLGSAAYQAWHQVEEVSGVPLPRRTGGLVSEDVDARAGAATGSRNLAGYQDAMRRHGVEFEALDAAEVTRRWPQFRLSGTEQAIYQAESGFVDPGKANATHLALARAAGATIRDNTPVLELRPRGDRVEVVTAEQTYLAEQVIVTADASSATTRAACG